MCIGIPMKIVQVCDGLAECVSEAEDLREAIDLSLVGDQPVGTWVLAFMGAAREVIEDERVPLLVNARQAMMLALQGGDVSHCFADLIDREPQLPEFLREQKHA
jgi:hydrogenase assembly chaperone HypC/HupF